MTENTAKTNWRTPPAPIPESKIAQEYTADVVVVGLGHAGTAVARAAAEAGVSVIGIEKMTIQKYWVWGRNIGHINSDFLASRGVPRVDPIELFNEWMRRSGNRANPKLVMQFCQKSGETFNWYIEPFKKEQMDTVQVEYWPLGSKAAGEISGQKFWVGTAWFDDKGVFRDSMGPTVKEGTVEKSKELLFGVDPKQLKGIFSLSHTTKANLERAREHGAELYFGMDAQQLVLKNERVVGIVAKNEKGQYIRYNAKKGIILATGDFGSNKEMCRDLITDIVDLFDEGEDFKLSGRDGRGIQMGVWAGGRLEARPLPTMGGNFTMPMSVIGSFGALWVDENGNRYCNEGFGDPVFAGFPGAPLKRGKINVVFDSGIIEDLSSGPPAHGAIWIGDPATKKGLEDNLAAARKAGAKGHPAGRGSTLYAADTFGKLADYIGFNNTVKQNFLETVKQYNEFCMSGRDEEFGKDKHLLLPLDEPPFYAQITSSGSSIGLFLVTVGGLLTDEYQNVLNQKKDPIPGLYATGNCCGRRFGLQYSTPVSGVSIGIAITLGREAGKTVANL